MLRLPFIAARKVIAAGDSGYDLATHALGAGASGVGGGVVVTALLPCRCHGSEMARQRPDLRRGSRLWPTLSSSWTNCAHLAATLLIAAAVLLLSCPAYASVSTGRSTVVRSLADATQVLAGYAVVDVAGTVATFGGAGYDGDLSSASSSSIVAIAATPDRKGYWLVSSSGSVSKFGDATFYGSAAVGSVAGTIVGMAATNSGKGYWLVTSSGQVLAFGNAEPYGSTAGRPMSLPIVGIAATPDAKGYWLVSSSGSVSSHGDARNFGSAAPGSVVGTINGMATTTDGKGYWLVSSSGQVLAFGNALSYGSIAGGTLSAPIEGIAATPAGLGYTLVASDGGVFTFGDATFEGSDVNPSEPPMEPSDFSDKDPKVVGVVYLSSGKSETSTGETKVSYFGDSLAWLDELYSNWIANAYAVKVADAATPGCGIAGDGELSASTSGATDPPQACASWYQRMKQALASEHPDVVVIELGYWESQSHLWNGSWVTLTDSSSYASAVENNLADLVALIKSYDAVPVLLTSPYYRDGTSNAEVDAWNDIVDAVATSTGSTVLDLRALIDRNDSYSDSVDGVTVRTSDGVHLTSQGVTVVIDPWLLPALSRIGDRAR